MRRVITAIRNRLRDDSGQEAVELAIVLPVILMVLVVMVDGLIYVGECARFDQVAPQVILAKGITRTEGGYDQGQLNGEVQAALQESFSRDFEQVSVSSSSGWGIVVYTCTLEVMPWPLSAGGGRVFNMAVPPLLTHEYRYAVDPYVAGGLL